jgi:hypothetical protein
MGGATRPDALISLVLVEVHSCESRANLHQNGRERELAAAGMVSGC